MIVRVMLCFVASVFMSFAVAEESGLLEKKGQSRSAENVVLAFQKNRSQVYDVYKKFLESNPGVQARYTFRLLISPEGKLLNTIIVKRDVEYESLEQELISVINHINFGEENVVETSIDYDFHFLPD